MLQRQVDPVELDGAKLPIRTHALDPRPLAASAAVLLTLGAALRSPREHLDQVIVQAVVELSLKSPLELWMIEVARVQFEIISVYGNR